MALIDNINSVAFSTAYQIDKILQVYTGSFSCPDSANTEQTIAHTWGESVLPIMIFSTDNSIWYVSGASQSDISGSVACDASSILVSAGNYSGSTKTCYYAVALLSE